MNRLQALVLDEQKEKVLKKLHDLGAVQISDCRERLSQSEWKPLLEAPASSPLLREITSSLMSINKWLDLFESIVPEQTDSFFKFLFNPSKPKKVPFEDIEGENLLSRVDEVLNQVAQATGAQSEQLEKAREDMVNLQNLKQSISKLGSTDIDLTYVEETSLTSVYLGTTLSKNVEIIQAELDKLTDQTFLLEHTAIDDTESLLTIVCLSQHAPAVSNFLRRTGFERIETGGYTGKPQEALRSIESSIDELKQKEKQLIAGITTSAGQFRDSLLALRELLQIEKERADTHGHLATSGPLCMIEGWTPRKKTEQVIREIETVTNGLAVIEATEPNNPNEKVPILLDNPPFFRHFEVLTNMYSPPKYNEIDPTVILTITFLFFFATMITDAFYGIITFALGFLMLRGGGRYGGVIRDFGVILTAGGLVTIGAGALTGGWFGNLLIDFAGMTSLKSLMIIDPMVDVLPFLIFAVAVGVIHLDIGIVLGMINDLKNGETKKAFTENLWLVLVQVIFLFFYLKTLVVPDSGAALFFNVLMGLSALAAVILLIMGHKGMAFFNLTGAIGDTLSYARLMALGLCTGGIAMTVNILADMSGGVAYIGVIFLFLILVVGHVFNWAVQILGAFVHGIRLHYVEFFGRFYEGGGDDFAPFAIKREITEIKN
jgi:V/A-type H+-transporting ATPase subunit I